MLERMCDEPKSNAIEPNVEDRKWENHRSITMLLDFIKFLQVR